MNRSLGALFAVIIGAGTGVSGARAFVAAFEALARRGRALREAEEAQAARARPYMHPAIRADLARCRAAQERARLDAIGWELFVASEDDPEPWTRGLPGDRDSEARA